MDRLDILHNKVKHGVPKIQKKKIKDSVLKDDKPTDYEREKICKNARKKAHNPVADAKREISNEVREHTKTLSESLEFDFIEEGLGYSDLDVTIYEEPISTPLSESLSSSVKTHYKALGVAEGVFAPIGAMSRNNRRYDDDHWEVVLENQHLQEKIKNRGMLGTIGHHNKKVDDEDLAKGLVSHIVTDLKVCEDKEGKPILYGKLEILNTPAGQLLKEYYEMGIPLYVSSRGGGKLLPVANENWKRVDKTNYFLETFDIVSEPGFLQAKPQYVHESLDESNEIQEEKAEEGKMTKKEPIVATDMTMEEIVNNMLHLDEKIGKLTKIVEEMTDKVFEGREEKKEEDLEKKKDHLEAEIEREVANKEREEAKEDDKMAKVDEGHEKEEKKIEKIEAEKDETEAKEDEKLAKKEKEIAKVDKEEMHEAKVEDEEKIEKTELADEEHDESDKEKRIEDMEEGKLVEGCEKEECHKEECKEEEKEEVEESINYKEEYEKSEKMVEALVPLVEKASKDYKELVEKFSAMEKELNSYKLSEEFNITIDEAKEKLAEKSYDELREELKSAIEESKEAEVEKTTEKIAESKDGIIAESKHVRVRRVKVHSAFND